MTMQFEDANRCPVARRGNVLALTVLASLVSSAYAQTTPPETPVTPSVVVSFNLDIDRGVLATQLDPAKHLGRLGMQSGDVITAVDNVEIYNMGDFWHAYLGPSDKVPAKLTVFGKKGPLSVTLPRPSVPSVNR